MAKIQSTQNILLQEHKHADILIQRYFFFEEGEGTVSKNQGPLIFMAPTVTAVDVHMHDVGKRKFPYNLHNKGLD